MFSAFLIALFAVVTIAAFIVWLKAKKEIKKIDNADTDGHSYGSRAPRRLAIGSLIVFIVALIVTGLLTITSTAYSQPVGEARVVRSFTGNIVSINPDSGLAFKAPWDDTLTFDIRNQTVTFAGDGSGHEGPAITAQDKDQAPPTIDIVVRYSINPDSVQSIYTNFGSQESFVTKVIENDIRAVVRNIPLQYHTSEFRGSREKAAVEIQTALSDKWKSLGVIVENVDLRNILYPAEIEKSLQDIQVNKNAATAAVAALETSKALADKTRLEAQAQADADQIIRCGAKTEKTDEVINGVTTQTLTIIPLQGPACQNRLNEQVLTSKYIDMLKAAAEKGNTIYVVPSNSSNILQLPAPK